MNPWQACSTSKIAWSIVVVLAFGLHVAVGQTKAAKIDQFMTLCYQYGQFNGSVLVADRGEVIYKKSFGFADMEWEIPNEPDTKFRIGSLTKAFTSMLVLQLVQQGKLKLDGEITDYLPEYPKKQGSKVSIHQLLTHTSGIPDYGEFPNYRDLSRNPFTPESLIRLFADSALRFEPGSKFSYSNSGYFLLGMIIERVTGKPYEQVLHENILNPLKMMNSGYDRQDTILKKRARGYEKKASLYVNAPYLDMSLPYSAGSLFSTVEDLYLWDQALYSDTLLPKQTRDCMFRAYIPAYGKGYGYGWVIGNDAVGNSNDSVMVIEHGGTISGFSALISRIPSGRHLIVLLSNSRPAAFASIARAIRGILFDVPYDLPKRSIAETMFTWIQEKGIATALIQYRELQRRHDTTYALYEDQMNQVGYRLLRSAKTVEAIEAFKLNGEAFPNSSNAYESLGVAYLVQGDKELAIRVFRRCLELDSTKAYASEQLKQLLSK